MLTGYLFRGGLNRPPPVADMSFQRLWQLGLKESLKDSYHCSTSPDGYGLVLMNFGILMIVSFFLFFNQVAGLVQSTSTDSEDGRKLAKALGQLQSLYPQVPTQTKIPILLKNLIPMENISHSLTLFSAINGRIQNTDFKVEDSLKKSASYLQPSRVYREEKDFISSEKQLYKRLCPSVHPSVRDAFF